MLSRAEITRRIANEDGVPMGVGEREALETAQTLGRWIEAAHFACLDCREVEGTLAVTRKARVWMDPRD